MGGLTPLLLLIPVSLIISYYDIRYFRIPDPVSLGAWVLGFIGAIAFQYRKPGFYLLSSFIAFSSYILVYFLTRGKLGWGDIKLSLFLGGISGVRGWYFTNLFAALSGLLYLGIMGFLKKRDIKSKLPFGPFLCCGALLNLLFIDNHSLYV